MKHRILITGGVLLMLLMASCREESDKLMAYANDDMLVFDKAENSYAEKFKVTWNGLNQYYALWDYEEQQGLDWDAVYNEYLPQFEALDKRDEPVGDDELIEMMEKVLLPLHDGHLKVAWKNHATGNNVVFGASYKRIELRDDYKVSKGFVPSLDYYSDLSHGEMMTYPNGDAVMFEYSTKWKGLYEAFCHTPGKGMMWIENEIRRIENLTIPTEMELEKHRNLVDLAGYLKSLARIGNDNAAINEFNDLASEYIFLRVPGFDVIDKGFADGGIDVKFAAFEDGILYLYLSDFMLTAYFQPQMLGLFDTNNSVTNKHIGNVVQTWRLWFEFIDWFRKQGGLKGVIIDVRSNGGGLTYDTQYVAGALLPSGGFQCGYQRYKRGTGRKDYSPLMPAYYFTLEREHEVIDKEPVVLLTNCLSASMAEMTAQVVKQMENGTVIGKRTLGATCQLGNNSLHSLNYSGYIGVMGRTPVFGYVPMTAFFTMDKQVLEGYGITPDIEVDFDETLFRTTGRDTQLERALQFIRNGN